MLFWFFTFSFIYSFYTMATVFPTSCPPSAHTSILPPPSIHSSISIQKTASLLWIIYKTWPINYQTWCFFDFYQNLINNWKLLQKSISINKNQFLKSIFLVKVHRFVQIFCYTLPSCTNIYVYSLYMRRSPWTILLDGQELETG